jgi:hypothetical protein
MKTPNRRLAIAAALVLALALAGCKNSAIFYGISTETKPKTAFIKGSPSKLVSFLGKTWTANGDLFAFDGSAWSMATKPAGRLVRDLAASGSALYALVLDGAGSALYDSADGAAWTALTNPTAYTELDKVYAAGPAGTETIFVGARKSDDAAAWAVLRVNGPALEAVKIGLGAGGNLVGAAWDGTNFYLASSRLGIFAATTVGGLAAATAATVSVATWSDCLLSGMATVGASVVAVGGNGHIVYGNAAGFTASDLGSSEFSGGLFVDERGTDDLLYLGLRATSSTYVYGYAELLLPSGSLPAAFALRVPGAEADSTVADKAQYAGSIGAVPVTQLFRPTGGPLFAATVGQGLWAYAGGEWNTQSN